MRERGSGTMRKNWILAMTAAAMFFAGMMVKEQVMVAEATATAEFTAVDADEAAGEIPNEAIRLRIIANSDADADQELKRDIRDEVIAEVANVVRGIQDEQEARRAIARAVPLFNEIAARVVREQGYAYDVQTDYGLVPFPTKMYGSTVYPAGDYEALRIRIGEAQGQNWWCVLFPPLCFVDMANGDAAAQPKDMEAAPAAEPAQEQEVEVRFALWETITGFFDSIFA